MGTSLANTSESRNLILALGFFFICYPVVSTRSVAPMPDPVNDKHTEKEIRKFHSQQSQKSWINLTKKVKYLYKEIFKTLQKETEEKPGSWKDLPCSQISRINTVKMAILPKAIYRFYATSSKLQCNSPQILQTNLIIYMATQKTQVH